MRRVKALKAGCKAKEDYYLEDESLDMSDYYSAAEIKSEAKKFTTAQWIGPGAESVGLEGYINKEEFKGLLYGALPDGTRIRQGKVSGKDNLLVDQVLSAPKSFSMYALQDERLFDAHMEAVKRTQRAVEEKYCMYREYQNGRKVNVKGQKLLCAALPHWTSRENQMQLHTHLLTFNGVQRADGQWRALDDRQLGYADWVGRFYRNELAKLTQELGYKITETKLKEGYSFEIDGVSRTEIEHFSTRSQQIATKAELDGTSRNAAVLSTRKPKHITKSFEEFRHDFLEEMEQRGSLTQTPSSTPIVEPLGRTDARAEIDSAIRHYSERSCSFSREDLLKFALDHIQNFELSDLDAAIDEHPSLIEVADPTRQRFTTAEGLERNIRIIQKWHAAPKVRSIMDEATALQQMRIAALLYPEKERLNPGQAEAIIGVLASSDAHQIIDGLAGVGKTTALKELKALNEKAETPLKICGFSPTIEASKTLQKEMGIEANTLESLLRSKAPRESNELWVVDEAGLASTRQAEELIDKAALTGARVLLVGDPKQNKSVEAGSPMRLLMQHGATVHSIHEIIRQKNKEQKQAVELIASGKGLEALTLLNEHNYVTEIKDQNARAKAVAKTWLSLSKADRLQTIVVTGTNAERLRITQYIRDGLRAEGKLGKEKTVQQLVSRQLTDELKTLSEEYQKGDYVQIASPRKGSSFAKGKTYKVVDHRGDRVLLESEQGKRSWMDPKRHRGIEVFYAQDMGVAVGDRLKWKITNKEQGYDNGAEFTVKRIQGAAIWIEDKDKQVQKIDGSKPLGIDYSLVSTGYSAQGQTAYRAIISATNDPTSAKEPFYVEISRQRMELLIFTENYTELQKWVKRSSIEGNPLELIGDNYHDYRKNSTTPTSSATRQFSNSTDSKGELGENRTTSPDYSRDNGRRNQWSSGGDEKDGGRWEQNTGSGWSIDNNHGSELNSDKTASRWSERSDRLDYGKRTEDRQTVTECLLELAYRKHLAAELTPRLQELQNTLQELYRVKSLNAALEAENNSKMEALLSAKNKEPQAAIIQKITEAKAMAKVEVLGVALETWRSLNEPTLSNPELDRYPKMRSQTAVDIAMEQFTESIPLPVRTPLPKPKKISLETVWEPEYQESDRPVDIEQHHWREMQQSAIRPDLIRLNIQSISGQEVIERLLEEEFTKPIYGAGQETTTKMIETLNDYRTLEHGGWWGTAGVRSDHSLETDPKPSLSGVFKADHPRVKVSPLLKFNKLEGNWVTFDNGLKSVSWDVAKKSPDDYAKYSDYKEYLNIVATASLLEAGINPNKFVKHEKIKYENPKGIERPVFLANVPKKLAEQIYAKHGIVPTENELKKGFWHIVHKYNLPIVLIEGEKKALAALSQGIIAIGTPGVALYRSRIKNEDGSETKLQKRELMEAIATWATPGRIVTLANDQDPPSKTKTIWNVRRDTVRSAELLSEAGCDVRIATWDYRKGKGGDDLIAKHGGAEFLKAIAKAKSWSDEARIWYRAQYKILSGDAKRVHNSPSQETVDRLVYRLAVEAGDRDDGQRFLSQSAGFRQQGIQYLKAIFKDQLVVKLSQKYAEMANKINKDRQLSPTRLDLEVYLLSKQGGSIKDAALLVSEGATAQSLAGQGVEAVQRYITAIESFAPMYERLKKLPDQSGIDMAVDAYMRRKQITLGAKGVVEEEYLQPVVLPRNARL